MIYDAIKNEGFRVKVFKRGKKVVLETEIFEKKETIFTPFSVRTDRAERKINPSVLIFLSGLIRASFLLPFNFRFRLSEDLSVKKENGKFKLIFLKEERAEDVVLIYSAKNSYPLTAFKLSLYLEEICSGYEYELLFVKGGVRVLREGFLFFGETSAGVRKEEIFLPELLLFLPAERPLRKEMKLGNLYVLKHPDGFSVLHRGTEVCSGNVFDLHAFVSALRSSVLLSR